MTNQVYPNPTFPRGSLPPKKEKGALPPPPKILFFLLVPGENEPESIDYKTREIDSDVDQSNNTSFLFSDLQLTSRTA